MKYETYFNILYSVLPFHSFEIFSKERISLSKHTPYTIHQDQAFLTLLGFTYAFTWIKWHSFCSARFRLKLNTIIGLHTHPTHPTTNFFKGSMHSRSPRFGMLASYRLTNYTTNLTVSHHPQEGHPRSQGWSPTIRNLPKGSVQQTWNLASKLNSQNQNKSKLNT